MDVGEIGFLNALSLRLFRKEAVPAEITAAAGEFRKDTRSGVFRVDPLPAEAIKRVAEIVRVRTPGLDTRTPDVLHVAAALALGCRVFYTFDKPQTRLARAEGLKTP